MVKVKILSGSRMSVSMNLRLVPINTRVPMVDVTFKCQCTVVV